jgi:AMP-binding enzyme
LRFAGQRSGLFYTAISHHLTPGEIAYIVRDCEAKVVVVFDAFTHLLGDLRQVCKEARFFLCGDTNDSTLDWRALRSSMPATSIADEVAGSDLLYSSGTTGRPKGVMRVFDRKPIDTAIPPLMTLLCETLGGMGEDTIYLSPAPLSCGSAALFNDDCYARRNSHHHGEIRRGGMPCTDRPGEGQPLPVCADDVRPDVKAAGGDPPEIRSFDAQGRVSCRRTLPARRQGADNRLGGDRSCSNTTPAPRPTA